MHLSSEGGAGGNVLLRQGMWRVTPETGQASLSDQALETIINADPIEKWYIIDPEPIARGQFAMVYHCKHRVTGEEYAAKFASRRRLGGDATPDIIHEITVNAILASCVRNIKLQDVFTTDTDFVLVMEYASGGDLQTLLDEEVVPFERDVISSLRQLLEGLVFIHDRSLVHLDIKPQNLVLMGEFPDCEVKLCDFEISRLLTPGYEVREILGTPDYVAPEILHYEPITTRTDMWSLGVLTYVLLTGFLPFGGDNDQETFMQISRGELDFPNELFEDITSEGIDFMKKLLIRQPEKRMSARECLNHPWMKNVTRPTPPSTLDISPSIKPFIPTPVCRAESSPSVISVTPVTKVEEAQAKEGNTADSNKSVTSEDVQSPTVTGRPPLHPRTSPKSMSVAGDQGVNSANGSALRATTPFLNKESRMGSRQNLSRLRSMSKSREVLSERVQMSNLKKTLSKSRERLYDARLGLSTSKDDLLKCQSLSQSVEALTALSQLHQNGALYKSCNNIFIPMVKPHIRVTNVQDRMYKSMASIDQIPGNDLSKKMGYFESRFSVDEDYNDIITKRNTNLNMVISDAPSEASMRLMGAEEARLGGLRGNPCRGGRSAEGSDRTHTHRQPEAQSTQKINKMSRSDRMKKDAQRRRKERKERELKEKERHRKYSLGDHENRSVKPTEKIIEGPSSPTMRRGSVCHVEQRLQERHERLLEKQEREGRQLTITGSRRLSSIDSDRSPGCERKSKSSSKAGQLTVSDDRSRSTTPVRHPKGKAESPQGSDVSQASSMESVIGSLENIQSRVAEIRNKSKSKLDSNLISRPSQSVEEKDNEENATVLRNTEEDNSSQLDASSEELNRDQDEAYISLEEGSKEIFLLREYSDDSESVESDKTCTGSLEDGQATPTDTVKSILSSPTNNIDDLCDESKEVTTPPIESTSTTESSTAEIRTEQILSTLQEEPEDKKYNRSISTTSDLGSMISEESEESTDQFNSDIDAKVMEHKTRARSYSVQHKTDNTLITPNVRNRSNSVHQGSPDKSRPWGDICSGSIAKALKNFTLQDDKQDSETPKTRLSTPPLSPSFDTSP